MTVKMCPIKLLAGIINYDRREKASECEKEGCMWFVEDIAGGHCSVRDIGRLQR